MTASTPARDFLLPRLRALIEEAAARDIDRDVSVAVLIDLVTGPEFNTVTLDPRQDDPSVNPGVAPVEVEEAARAYAEAIPLDDVSTAAGFRRGGQHRMP